MHLYIFFLLYMLFLKSNSYQYPILSKLKKKIQIWRLIFFFFLIKNHDRNLKKHDTFLIFDFIFLKKVINMLLHYSFSSNEFMAYEVMKNIYIIKGKSINVEFLAHHL